LLYPNPGGPRQPLDRQFRYYSEALRLASATLVGAGKGGMTGVVRIQPWPRIDEKQILRLRYALLRTARAGHPGFVVSHPFAKGKAKGWGTEALQNPRKGPRRTKRRSNRGGVSGSCIATGLPEYCGRRVFPPYLLQTSPAGLSLFEGRFVGGCSCRASAVLWLSNPPRQPVHHWHLSNSNWGTVWDSVCFQLFA
jgi:hypothetical protein